MEIRTERTSPQLHAVLYEAMAGVDDESSAVDVEADILGRIGGVTFTFLDLTDQGQTRQLDFKVSRSDAGELTRRRLLVLEHHMQGANRCVVAY